MRVDAEPNWIAPYKGYRYASRQMAVDSDEQIQRLAWCGVDAMVFGDVIDPAGFITLAIREGVRNGIHSNGGVNMGNRIVQHRPMRLGEPLTVSGEILAVDEVPRGTVVTSETWYSGADGRRALLSHRKSLRPDPAKAGVRGGGEQPPPFIEDVAHTHVLATFTFTQESVKAYAGPNNPIHFDPEAARRGGFRAPIIGGGQGVRLLTAEIWRRFRPQALDFEVQFRRPIFWDETVHVVVDAQDGQWRSIGLVKGDKKVATEARIHHIG